MRYVATVGGRARRVEVTGGQGRYRVTLDGESWEVDARRPAEGVYSLLIDGASYVADVRERQGAWIVDVGGESHTVEVDEETRHVLRTSAGAAGGDGGQTLTAPMPGKISQVAVGVGDTVGPGQTLVVIEAMKMENEFKAIRAGTVIEVRVQPGQAVNAGDVLVVVR